MKFKELNLSPKLLEAITQIGFDETMEIQARAIPVILAGHDVIGQAQTGTGKTAAFGIPLIEMSNIKHAGIEHLIISPTRELAMQIKKELELLGKLSQIKIGLIVGGANYNTERAMLKTNPNIIVGTPGRLLDHLNNNKIDLGNLKTLTLDEADEMLDIGFKEELNAIIDFMPKNRQSLLFSATMGKDVKVLANKMLKNPQEILVSSGLKTVDTVEQLALIVDEKEKFRALIKILEANKPESVMIFGRTKRRAAELAQALSENNYRAYALHGDLSQRERTTIMDGFKSNQFPILVATDVAARGIHVDGVSCVINFDLPQEIEYYVHRIGRTGRAGLKGSAISFLRKSEFGHLQLIERMTNTKIKIIDLPDKKIIKSANDEFLFKMITEALQEPSTYIYFDLAKKLINTYGAEVALASALELLQPNTKINDVELTGEPPVRVKVAQQPKKNFPKRNYSQFKQNKTRNNTRKNKMY